MIDKKYIMDELLKMQRKNISHKRKLNYNDMYRISKFVNKSLFDDKCCLWTGYVCSVNKNKIYYINFFFGGKKIQINRLLYENYIGDIKPTEIIKNICENGGKCCNVYHYGKFDIINKNTDDKEEIDEENDEADEADEADKADEADETDDYTNIEQFKIIF